MQRCRLPPSAKPDNLFGVCAALGEDFGFNPLWLRIALGAGVLWNPLAVLGVYVALGALVLATRSRARPDRKRLAVIEQRRALPDARTRTSRARPRGGSVAQQLVDAGLAARLRVDALDDHRAVEAGLAVARRRCAPGTTTE